MALQITRRQDALTAAIQNSMSTKIVLSTAPEKAQAGRDGRALSGDRNHIGTMTDAAIALNSLVVAASVDAGDAATATTDGIITIALNLLSRTWSL